MLYEILYSSAANWEMTPEQLQELSTQASETNKVYGLSGCLLYHKREFLQILEGEQDQVEIIFAKILEDERHSHLKVIWRGPIERRAFASWAMAFVNLEEASLSASIQEKIDQGINTAEFTGHQTTARELFEIIRQDMI